MRHRWLWLAVLVAFTASMGCTPRVRVRKAPGPEDTGIRYYRPKPYLRVEPAGQSVTQGKTTTTSPSDEFVAITLEYLPDFSEEYSIDIRPGLGSANVSLGLEDGWNLTSINQELDSQFDENVEAVAQLAKAASGFIPTKGSGDGHASGTTRKFVVSATNVPIGYYESVITKDACGRKRLYGWRYVGFMPYSPCPAEPCLTEICGSQHPAYGAFPADLFGIIFEGGVMKFQRLESIEGESDLTKTSVSSGDYLQSASLHQRLDGLTVAIRKALLATEGVESSVEAKMGKDAMTVELTIELLGPIDEKTTRERLIKTLVSFEDVEDALIELGDPVPSFVEIR